MSDAPKIREDAPVADLPSASFCVLPWMHLFVDERGILHPCCMALDSKQPITDERGEPYRIENAGAIEAAWSSPFMKKMRLDLLGSRRPEACARCFQHEDLGMSSYRRSSNGMYRHHVAGSAARTSPDGDVPVDFYSVDLRLGNVCNLKCRMCSPHSSKALIAEFADLWSVDKSHPYLTALEKLDWFSRPEFWEVFERYTSQVERLHFAGGEPLLIPQMFSFLEKLVASGRSKDIVLSYITNATVLPDEVRALWPRFKEVRLTVSLDAFGELNSFIRHPSRWDALDRNLRTLDEDAAALNLRHVSFNTTVQLYNVLHLTELFDYTFGFKFCEPYPTLSILNHPSCFSVQVLPRALKEEAGARLARFRAAHEGRWPAAWRGNDLENFLGDLDGVVGHLLRADREEELGAFFARNDVFDRHRRQQLLAVLPELAPFAPAARARALPLAPDGET